MAGGGEKPNREVYRGGLPGEERGSFGGGGGGGGGGSWGRLWREG